VLHLLCDYGSRVRGLHRLQFETVADKRADDQRGYGLRIRQRGNLRSAAWITGQFAHPAVFGLLAADSA